jgi:hypothetical protein|tara:strand:- start:223 stop:420 length:198 start_codon:yes stop_codon:yes gene_type:complete
LAPLAARTASRAFFGLALCNFGTGRILAIEFIARNHAQYPDEDQRVSQSEGEVINHYGVLSRMTA